MKSTQYTKYVILLFTGGIWNYTEHIRPSQGAGAYEGLVANDGKELMAFSDYPIPEHYAIVGI